MTTEEAKLIEEKLQGVLKSIEDYGNQVEQFGKTRVKLEEILDVNNKFASSLNDIVASCNNLIQEVKTKVYDDTFAIIKEETNKIQKTASDLQSSFASTSEQIVDSNKDIETKVDSLIKSLNESCDELKNKLEVVKNALFDVQNIISGDIESAENALINKIDDTSKQTKEEIESLKEELKLHKIKIKQEITTNRKILTAATIILALIFVAVIVGLFI